MHFRIALGLSFLCSLLTFELLHAGTRNIKGRVTDAGTGEALAFATVAIPGTQIGTLTDDSGRFALQVSDEYSQLNISMMGYRPQLLLISGQTADEWVVAMEEEGTELEEVRISAGRSPRYRNRDNPAVALIQKVRNQREQHFRRGKFSSMERYDKLVLALSQDRHAGEKDQVLRKFAFMTAHGDTLTWPGKVLYPVYMEESLKRLHTEGRKTPAETLLAEEHTSLDPYVDQDGLDAYLRKMYVEADIYTDNIKLGDQEFLSPLGPLAPQFYKYYITDTLDTEDGKRIKLFFAPRSKADRLFKGEMLITFEDHYAVTDVWLRLDPEANINWVSNFKMQLQYSRKGNLYFQSMSQLDMEMSLYQSNKRLSGTRLVTHRKFVTGDEPEGVTDAPEIYVSDAGGLAGRRHVPLSAIEAKVYSNIDSLRQTRAFKRTAGLATLLLSGYQSLGLVEIGPVHSFYSYNPIEGLRLRLGGRTSEQFSKRLLLQGHAAYGFRDRRWKYAAEAQWSLSPRAVQRFPVRALLLSHSYETMIPGQELAFLEEDNILMSIKRGKNDKWMYERKWSLSYVHETRNHWSFRAGYRYAQLEGAGALQFPQAMERGEEQQLTVSELNASIRWAPEEQFYQGKKIRKQVINRYPVFTLRASAGIKGMLNGKYTYQNLAFNIYKRFYLSQAGFTDVSVEAGKVFGSAPWPMQHIHRGNQSYAYQLGSYNMMNFMEFVSTQYVSLHMDHSFNGFIFNKLPLINKLRLREVVSAKVMYGSFDRKNEDPGLTNLSLPVRADGSQVSYSAGSKPYVEGSVGISNIFKVLRVDVVKRFTYLDHPEAAEWGVRTRINFDF